MMLGLDKKQVIVSSMDGKRYQAMSRPAQQPNETREVDCSETLQRNRNARLAILQPYQSIDFDKRRPVTERLAPRPAEKADHEVSEQIRQSLRSSAQTAIVDVSGDSSRQAPSDVDARDQINIPIGYEQNSDLKGPFTGHKVVDVMTDNTTNKRSSLYRTHEASDVKHARSSGSLIEPLDEAESSYCHSDEVGDANRLRMREGSMQGSTFNNKMHGFHAHASSGSTEQETGYAEPKQINIRRVDTSSTAIPCSTIQQEDDSYNSSHQTQTRLIRRGVAATLLLKSSNHIFGGDEAATVAPPSKRCLFVPINKTDARTRFLPQSDPESAVGVGGGSATVNHGRIDIRSLSRKSVSMASRVSQDGLLEATGSSCSSTSLTTQRMSDSKLISKSDSMTDSEVGVCVGSSRDMRTKKNRTPLFRPISHSNTHEPSVTVTQRPSGTQHGLHRDSTSNHLNSDRALEPGAPVRSTIVDPGRESTGAGSFQSPSPSASVAPARSMHADQIRESSGTGAFSRLGPSASVAPARSTAVDQRREGTGTGTMCAFSGPSPNAGVAPARSMKIDDWTRERTGTGRTGATDTFSSPSPNACVAPARSMKMDELARESTGTVKGAGTDIGMHAPGIHGRMYFDKLTDPFGGKIAADGQDYQLSTSAVHSYHTPTENDRGQGISNAREGAHAIEYNGILSLTNATSDKMIRTDFGASSKTSNPGRGDFDSRNGAQSWNCARPERLEHNIESAGANHGGFRETYTVASGPATQPTFDPVPRGRSPRAQAQVSRDYLFDENQSNARPRKQNSDMKDKGYEEIVRGTRHDQVDDQIFEYNYKTEQRDEAHFAFREYPGRNFIE